MFRTHTNWLLFLLLAAAMPLVAQTDTYTPLTAGEDYAWTMHQITDPMRLSIIALRAGIDHAEGDPNGWGQAQRATRCE